MSAFNDQFSGHARIYSRARPVYPPELFGWLASLAPGNSCAWDCATGNGQAAVSLTNHFNKIIATDASTKQLELASHHEKIEYRQAVAEESGIEEASVDLITVATAAHWFRLDSFYAEARRVMRDDGVIAMWTYFYTEISPEIDPLVRKLNNEILGEFWTPPMRQASKGYDEMAFPFSKIEAPQVFRCRAEWNLEQLKDWFTSWSLTQRYLQKYGRCPVDEIAAELESAWGDVSEKRVIYWPLSLTAGRK